MNAFEKWFIDQHGARPHPGAGSDHEVRACITDGNVAQAVLKQRLEWDARHESALYAWQARDSVSISGNQTDR